MDNNSRTVYGNYLQTCLLLGITPQFPQHTTLNQRLNISASTLPGQSDRISLSTYSIGIGGHRSVIGANGITKTENINHAPTDSGLYYQIPFVLRQLNNDLSAAQRSLYALRRVENHNSTPYIAYYARRIDKTNLVPQMEYKTIVNGTESTFPFVPTAANLNPTPPIINNNGVNTTSGDYITAAARMSLIFTPQDIEELLNVSNVMFNDEGYAIISEISLNCGVDRAVTVDNGAQGTFNFLESIGTTIISHIPSLLAAKASNNGSSISLDVGATEPMWLTNQN